MSLKQSHKLRIDFDQIQHGDWDYDGNSLVMYDGNLFTGYVIFDRFQNGSIQNENEYKNGSHLGWENEYNINGQLTYSCLTVGETPLEVYKYDDSGNLIHHWKTVGDIYYEEMITKFQLD